MFSGVLGAGGTANPLLDVGAQCLHQGLPVTRTHQWPLGAPHYFWEQTSVGQFPSRSEWVWGNLRLFLNYSVLWNKNEARCSVWLSLPLWEGKGTEKPVIVIGHKQRTMTIKDLINTYYSTNAWSRVYIITNHVQGLHAVMISLGNVSRHY